MSNMKREFKGVWIPSHIWETKDLYWTEKLLLVEIDSLSSTKLGCFASNEYFAQFFDLSKDRISRMISSLKQKGYIDVKITYKPNSKEVDKRIITPIYLLDKALIPHSTKQQYPIGENNNTPIGEYNNRGIGENNKDNNTLNNNTLSIKPPKELKKPTKKEKVKIELDFLGEFFEDNNISIDFFESVKEWITYKNSKNETYQKETFKIQLNKWLKWANYDKEVLQEMIDKAIGANWSGLFKPNKPNNYTPKGQQTNLEQMNYNQLNDYAKEIGGMNLYMQVMLISEENLPEKIKAIKQYQINQKFNNLNGV